MDADMKCHYCKTTAVARMLVQRGLTTIMIFECVFCQRLMTDRAELHTKCIECNDHRIINWIPFLPKCKRCDGTGWIRV